MRTVEYKHIQSHSTHQPTITINSTFGSLKKRTKRCSFRTLSQDSSLIQTASSQYFEYMKQQSFTSISQKIEETSSNDLPQCSYDTNQEDDEPNVEIMDFLEKSKLNTYKNIIFAFFKHIQECTDPIQQEKYVQLTKDKWEFKHISLRVYQNLRNCGRSNLKIKNLIQNRNLKGVFINFLENSDKLWIDQSKIKDKEGFKKQINLLIQAYQQNILANNIQFYKKHKK